jgi:hypothetical protein
MFINPVIDFIFRFGNRIPIHIKLFPIIPFAPVHVVNEPLFETSSTSRVSQPFNHDAPAQGSVPASGGGGPPASIPGPAPSGD